MTKLMSWRRDSDAPHFRLTLNKRVPPRLPDKVFRPDPEEDFAYGDHPAPGAFFGINFRGIGFAINDSGLSEHLRAKIARFFVSHRMILVLATRHLFPTQSSALILTTSSPQSASNKKEESLWTSSQCARTPAGRI
ncbi:hypothetical protein BJX66DRAFT_343347 [Aspergillus keveii]|uniref:Uncharacterized protein n=1 Tax=Aspergillus keveii TaxID=714993 RepID=A0ABR4FPM8_9EURO